MSFKVLFSMASCGKVLSASHKRKKKKRRKKKWRARLFWRLPGTTLPFWIRFCRTTKVKLPVWRSPTARQATLFLLDTACLKCNICGVTGTSINGSWVHEHPQWYPGIRNFENSRPLSHLPEIEKGSTGPKYLVQTRPPVVAHRGKPAEIRIRLRREDEVLRLKVTVGIVTPSPLEALGVSHLIKALETHQNLEVSVPLLHWVGCVSKRTHSKNGGLPLGTGSPMSRCWCM